MPYTKDASKSSNQIWDPSIVSEDMSKLRVFGSKVYCKNYESLKTDAPALSKASQQEYGQSTFPTWGTKGWQGIFLGFDLKVPDAWRVLSFKTKAFQQTIHMVANENLEASAPSQHFTRESLLTLLHLRKHMPLTSHQTIAFEQILSDNSHLLYEEWYFTQAEFDQRHPIDIALETQRYKQLKKEVLSSPDDKLEQKKEYDFISHHALLTAISLDSNVLESIA
jgi:hypothetical protein